MAHLKNKPNLFNYKKIFISHYGKIASNTLAQSLADATNQKRTSIKSDRHYDEFILTTGLNTIVQLNHSDKSSKRVPDNRKFLVITVCRNLINRLVSMYFQVHSESALKLGDSEEIIKKIDFSNKIFSKLDKFPSDLVKNCNLGFDLYDELSKIPKDQQYFFKKGPKIDFLLLKYETIKDWPLIFASLFNLSNFKLVDRNLSQDKDYKDLYEIVLELVKQKEFVNKAYGKTKHFSILGL
jgi:hypothetical protein